MKVVLLEDVPGTASAGDVKEVKAGFARNYLFLQHLAAPASAEQLNRVEALKKSAARKRAKTEAENKELAAKLESLTVTLKAKAGTNEKLFGSITVMQVAEAVSQAINYEIDRHKLVMSEPIRNLGTYSIPVKLFTGIETKVTVIVQAEGREQVKATAPAEAKAPEEATQETAQTNPTTEAPSEAVTESEAPKQGE